MFNTRRAVGSSLLRRRSPSDPKQQQQLHNTIDKSLNGLDSYPNGFDWQERTTKVQSDHRAQHDTLECESVTTRSTSTLEDRRYNYEDCDNSFAWDSEEHVVCASFDDDINSKKNSASSLIEVSPGVMMKLRGADETYEAIQRDFFTPHACFGRDLTIFCISDAHFVICPICRLILPVEINSKEVNAFGTKDVGLGFTFDELARIQATIRARRDCQEGMMTNQRSSCSRAA